MVLRGFLRLLIVVTGIFILPVVCDAQNIDLDVNLNTVHPIEKDTVSLREAMQNTLARFKKTHKIQITDTVVKFPKFINFCLKVYNWAEKTFNTYDPEYVIGTGKHGKVRLVSDNWSDYYYCRFKNISPLIMASTPYSNLGIQANYSIISAGYSIDMNAIVSGKKSHHKKTSFGLTTARVIAEGYYWRNKGATVIRRFGNVHTGKLYNIEFDGIDSKCFGVQGYYLFNYKKYSHAAAYNLSNYQLKSAGSWMIGMNGTFYDCSFDFDRLPEEVKAETHFPFNTYRFDFNSVGIEGGYGYNWVINKHLLFNVTTTGGMGMAFSFSKSTMGSGVNWAFTLRHLASLTYHNRQFFVTGSNNLRGNLLQSDKTGFGSGIDNLQISTGVRF